MQTEISAPGAAVAPADRPLISADDRKVLAATLVGSTIEWYDYFIYSQAAGLVLGTVLRPFTQNNPEWALILSFATVGVAFLFRPLAPSSAAIWATATAASACWPPR